MAVYSLFVVHLNFSRNNFFDKSSTTDFFARKLVLKISGALYLKEQNLS